MARFLVRRIFLGVVVMWMVATIVFILYFVTPHDPARLIAGKDATAQMLADVTHRLGLDKPIIQQYGSYLWRLLHGNLGYSYFNSEPVSTIVAQDLPVTASLAIGGAVIWLVLGVLAGVLAATKPRSAADRTVTALALFFYSMPTFLLGELFLLLLFFRLHLLGFDFFPGSGYVGLSQSVGGWASTWSCPGSPWPWSPGPSTPGSRVVRCWTYWVRTTYVRLGPRACPNGGSSTVMPCGRP